MTPLKREEASDDTDRGGGSCDGDGDGDIT